MSIINWKLLFKIKTFILISIDLVVSQNQIQMSKHLSQLAQTPTTPHTSK